jgi:hypothetical protein
LKAGSVSVTIAAATFAAVDDGVKSSSIMDNRPDGQAPIKPLLGSILRKIRRAAPLVGLRHRP